MQTAAEREHGGLGALVDHHSGLLGISGIDGDMRFRLASWCVFYPLAVVFPTLCGLRAREGVGEPLTSARAIEIASEIGVVLPVLCPRRGREGARRASA